MQLLPPAAIARQKPPGQGVLWSFIRVTPQPGNRTVDTKSSLFLKGVRLSVQVSLMSTFLHAFLKNNEKLLV